MGGFQFVHMAAYGRSVSKCKKTSTWSAKQVVAEAEREPDACPHVAHPKPPEVVYGCRPSEVLEEIDRQCEGAKDAGGRKLRADANVLATAVMSYPVPMAELEADPAKMEAYRAWKADALDWIKSEWGDRLLSVVEHTDEAYGHLHCYGVPERSAEGRMELGALHPGLTAKAEARRSKVPAGQENEAYKAAMKGVQDRYWEKVGLRHGQARLGPGGRRLTRAEWKAEQSAVSKAAAAMAVVERLPKQAEAAVRKYRGAVAAKKTEIVQQAKEEITALKSERRELRTEVKAAKAEVVKVRSKAEKEAAAIVEQAKAAAARVVKDAERRAADAVAKATANARRLGGWVNAFVSYAKGQGVAERIEAVVKDRDYDWEQKLNVEKLSRTAAESRVKELKGEVVDLRHKASAVADERDRARERGNRLEAELERYKPKPKVAAQPAPKPAGPRV